MDGALEESGPLVLFTVVVGGTRDAQFVHAGQKGVAQGVMPVEVGDAQLAFAAPVEVVSHPDLLLQAAEVRQHLGIGPAGVAGSGPGVVVFARTAHERHAVDRAAAAEHAPLRQTDAALDHPARLGGEVPGKPAAVHVPDVANRQVNERTPVGPASLQQAHACPGGAQTVGQQAAGRAGTHHHIIELAIHIGFRSHWPAP